MKDLSRNPEKRDKKTKEYPENQVGFPERNDCSDPDLERERVHVDLETLDISRKSAGEIKEELTGEK
jgi:hypothetical protein